MSAGAADTGRVLVIGLDGAEWDVIKPLMEDGELPNLQQLMEQGQHGNLTTTLPIESPVAWTSMTTGTTPGKHGIYGFLKRDGDRFAPTTADDVRVDRVWNHLDGEVILMNIPQTFPPEQVDGYMISGYLSLKDVGYTYPASLQQEIERMGYSIEALDDEFDHSQKDAFLDRLGGTVENRTRVAKNLMDRNDWKLGFIVYTGLDRLQHYLWKDMEQEDEQYGDAIPDHYRLLDEQIGELQEHVGKNTTLMVVSDHGFGPLRKNIYVNTWLRKQGYLYLEGRAGGNGLLASIGLTQQNIVDILSNIGLLGPIKGFFSFLGFNPGTSLPAPDMSDIDFSRTEVYAGNYGGKIYLTEQVGEEEREELLSTLIDRLHDIRDPETGEAVFNHIHRSEDIYTGNREESPDLVLEERPSYRAVGFLGHQEVVKDPPKKSGTHRKEGIYIIDTDNGTGEVDGHITDVAPTTLDLLGDERPDYIDGKSLLP